MSNFNKTIKTLKIFSANSNSFVNSSAKVIQEISLTINVNGKKLANIACAGIHLKELAVGFLKSEKIIVYKEEIEKIKFNKCHVNVVLKNKKDFLQTSVKNIASSGARGKTNIDLLAPLNVPADFNIKTSVVLELMNELLNGSAIHNKTGGTHCSALVLRKKIVALREDIGRHNTIDMLAGFALLQKINLRKAIILTTGRISAEIIYKIWNMGIPIIISHSAPTTSAVDLAHKANILLIGYVRNGKMNIYSQKRRMII
ncbi:MAG: formate dehydrogenase accessory sulfurtransferase FdhD [Syntrophaceae bacterium]|nr:formate dehydrogenase accessory sulfurtransferase FdhD [Syntrophaceae bacterium]